MRVKSTLSLVGLLLVSECARAIGAWYTDSAVYNMVRASPSYGIIDFSKPPNTLVLGATRDLRVKIEAISLKLGDGIVPLPTKEIVHIFREYAVERPTIGWVSSYLFGRSGVVMKGIEIVFPYAMQKRLANCDVANISLKNYPVKAIVQRKVTLRSGETKPSNLLQENSMTIISSLFTTGSIRCYGEITGGPLTDARTDDDRTRVAAQIIRTEGLVKGYRLKSISIKAGYIGVELSGRFDFDSGQHVFSNVDEDTLALNPSIGRE